MVTVQEQYEAYPYPERDPADEAKRLITGSPSHPLEIDHFLFQGRRDWSKPLRALVAGGGTGDGLVQLAQVLTSAGRPYEITYLDLSKASRAIAEARAKARGLHGITFVTGSLLDAPDHGQFDYIDCCGVLHHLPDPAAGFAALRAALAPGGGLGFMVYAPYGRSGVYPLQEAFGTLLGDLPPAERLARARKIVADLPESHPFRANKNLTDHQQSDAGFYDLLLHSQDRAYDVIGLNTVLQDSGWQLLSFATPALYDLARYAPVPKGMPPLTARALAEKLNGTIKMHVAYAVPRGDTRKVAGGADRALIPHLRGVAPQALAQAVARGKALPLSLGGLKTRLTLPTASAPVLAQIDGRRSLAQIATAIRLDPISFGATWGRLGAELADWGVLLYSALDGTR
ncbi:bifunctional 2-polyprenyl-6-hydroxyphenol methylase/3-demethylubiquinol 3-O-methyltransferase UbiG [Puniceibacterium sp. IMCC21224]|uniref:class I SAM-dependent methyltransferase n=1 Tax=Puniceibacterium sp. IMCC21224 TaxID=1618204 RepID=UPI00064DB68D|nr:class I SAM-dependent methyltransferase [Puniceibacterium sp. IMCC21224]KMK68885.1 methyltransferase family protein [Puniceibacterium sp. IMCC21224]